MSGDFIRGRGRLHKAFLRFLVHAAPRVGNGDEEGAFVGILSALEVDLQGDLALLGELDRVVQQMEEDLPHALRIDLKIRHVFVPVAEKCDGLARHGDVKGMQDLFGPVVEVGQDRFDDERVGFESGAVDHVADELKQGASAGRDGVAGSVALLLVGEPFFQELGVTDDGVQRSADVVADAGEKIALGFFGGDGAVAGELELAVDADDFFVLTLDDRVSRLAFDADRDHVRDLFEELFAESEGFEGVSREERGDLAPFVALEEYLAGDEDSGRAVFGQGEFGDVVVVDHHVAVVTEERGVGGLQRAVDALVAVGVLVVREPVLARAVVPVQQHVLAAERFDEAPRHEVEQFLRFGVAEQERRDLVAEMLGVDLLLDLGYVLHHAEEQGAAVLHFHRQFPVQEDAAVAVAPQAGVFEVDEFAFRQRVGVCPTDDLKRFVLVEFLVAFADHFGGLQMVQGRKGLVAADIAEIIAGILHDAGEGHQIQDIVGDLALADRLVLCLGERGIDVFAFERVLDDAGVLLQEGFLDVGEGSFGDVGHGEQSPE